LPAGFTFNMAYGDSKLAPDNTMALSTTRHTVGLDTLEPITFAAPGAYGSNFMTTPIASFISGYAPPTRVSVTNPDIVYDTPAITLPISYEKTNQTFFDHYPAVNFADSLHWVEGDIELPAHNPTTIRARQLSRITPAPVYSQTKALVEATFVDGKQPTIHIPKQYSFVGNYGLQTRVDGDNGTYLPNHAPTIPTSTLQFASIFGPIKDSRFKTGDAINMAFTDIFGHSYAELSLNSNIIIPADSPAHFTSYDDEKKYGSLTFSSGKQTVGSRLTGDSNTKTMEPYTNEFQLGKDHQNSPKFKNTGFVVGGAYYPDETLGKSISDSGTAITVKSNGRVKSLKSLHEGKYLDDYYGKYDSQFKKDGSKRDDPTGFRNDDVIGFDQPYIIKKIGDKWGIDGMGGIDAGVVRGGLNTAIARTISDELRIAKFILTPKGIIFGIKQAIFQRFNTKAETRDWNPLSLFASAVPTVHANRHFDDLQSSVGVLSDRVRGNAIAITNNPTTWFKNKYENVMKTTPLDQSDNAPSSETSLQSHFDKEKGILRRSPGPLVAKLENFMGIAKEKSREMDKNQFNWNHTGLENAVSDAGDQGPAGIIQFNYDKTLLGATISDFGIGNTYMTSKVDKVNALPYGSVKNEEPTKINGSKVVDFIPFKFKDVVNNKWIIFRAILSGISDSVSPDWTEEKYIGRPDKVYTYAGVDREISFNFNVYPKTKQELPILWEKMNYLVGLCYPSWQQFDGANFQRMVSPFVELTIGNLWKNTPGFLTSLSITVEDSTTWETDSHLQFPKYLGVSIGYKYIGKYQPDQLGKHYELDWIDLDKYGNRGSTAEEPYNGFNNYPDRSSSTQDMRRLFEELNQAGNNDGKAYIHADGILR